MLDRRVAECEPPDASSPCMEAIRESANALLDFVYPPKCYLCGAVGDWVCATCVASWPRPEQPACPRCGHPLPIGICEWCGNGMQPLRVAAFPFAFADAARDAVHLLKYGAKRRIARPMAEEMARAYWSAPQMRAGEVLVPVGLHPKRLRRRGYNQSEWLAAELSGILGLPAERWSVRVRDTRAQVGLSRQDRASNVAGAFDASSQAAGRRVILVDDVSTTGATARSAASALVRAGTPWVALLTFARDL